MPSHHTSITSLLHDCVYFLWILYVLETEFHGYICIGPHPDTDNIMDPKPVEGEEQAKKRRGRKKSKLEDMFPAYLQVCRLYAPFFKHLNVWYSVM